MPRLSWHGTLGSSASSSMLLTRLKPQQKRVCHGRCTQQAACCALEGCPPCRQGTATPHERWPASSTWLSSHPPVSTVWRKWKHVHAGACPCQRDPVGTSFAPGCASPAWAGEGQPVLTAARPLQVKMSRSLCTGAHASLRDAATDPCWLPCCPGVQVRMRMPPLRSGNVCPKKMHVCTISTPGVAATRGIKQV